MRTLAIDPGNTESAYVLTEAGHHPSVFGKIDNDELLGLLYKDEWMPDRVVIEMIASYGMAVGADVFETCVWIGRFAEVLARQGSEVSLIKRREVKLHHCHSARAKDPNVTQALVDRFAPGEPNFGKGTKANPGWFYGFSKDVWAAYALAVYAADKAL